MRPLLVLLVGICGTAAVARVFRESPAYRGSQYLVPAAAYSNRRILRSPADARTSRSRVFRNVVVNANALLDEPRLRSQGRFYKRAQAVPIHDVSQHPGKDAIQIMAYNYDEDKHHEKKLVEDGMTMVEARDFARNLERTTVSVKTEETTTTPSPVTTTTAATTTRPPPPRPEFQQPPAAFAQPPPVAKQVPPRTFSQTVQAGSGIIHAGTGNVQPQLPPQLPPQTGVPQLPQIPPQQILPGRSPVLPQFPQQPPFPNGLIPAIPGTPALPNPIGIPPDALQLVVPPQGQVPLVPPVGLPPQGVVPAIPNLPPPQVPQPPQIPNLPNQFPTGPGPNGPIPNIPNQIPGPGPNGGPPHNVLPARENRFEVINQQAANSSLEQLGCGFDWITNSCKDVFNIGWCGRCHDFGNIFLHDCKCIQPLVQLPPRPTQPRPTFLRLL